MFFSDFGTIGPGGSAFGGLLIPNLPVLVGSGLTIYVGFVTSRGPSIVPFSAISSPSSAIVIN
jgi:hypothetical protein